MGDRAYTVVHCRKQDIPTFENLNFTDQGESSPGIHEMVDEERNYASTDELPRDIPYWGHNAAGCDYGELTWYCEGDGKFHEHSASLNDYVVIPIDRRTGLPDPADLERAYQFVMGWQRVLALFESLAPTQE